MNKLIKVHRIWREKKLKFYLHSISVEVPCVSTRRTTLLCIEYPLCLELRTKHGIGKKKNQPQKQRNEKSDEKWVRVRNQLWRTWIFFSYIPRNGLLPQLLTIIDALCVSIRNVSHFPERSEQTRLNTCVSGCHCAFRHLFPLCD